MQAEGKIKFTASSGQPETVISERYYLSDASFLVALIGDKDTLTRLKEAVQCPGWPVFLGRKSCPPSVPVFAGMGEYPDLLTALSAQPWRPRLVETDTCPSELHCIVETGLPGPDASVRYDVPVSFSPRRFEARYVREVLLPVQNTGQPTQQPYRRPTRVRMRYSSRAWHERRDARSEKDRYLCVFCNLPSAIVHHVTYERAMQENLDDLRSVCRLCHDAITMLESERDMGKQRIDPLSDTYRRLILSKRGEILRLRAPRHSHKRRR